MCSFYSFVPYLSHPILCHLHWCSHTDRASAHCIHSWGGQMDSHEEVSKYIPTDLFGPNASHFAGISLRRGKGEGVPFSEQDSGTLLHLGSICPHPWHCFTTNLPALVEAGPGEVHQWSGRPWWWPSFCIFLAKQNPEKIGILKNTTSVKVNFDYWLLKLLVLIALNNLLCNSFMLLCATQAGIEIQWISQSMNESLKQK